MRVMTPEEIEAFNQQRYQHVCSIAQVSIDHKSDPQDYFSKLVNIKLSYLRKYAAGKNVLDVGCGSGDYLFELKELMTLGMGIDFTDKAIEAANAKKALLVASNIQFVNTSAKQLGLADGTFDVVFSFSALAYMPQLNEIVKEMARVLNKGGVAILEIGNLNSLNTYVCKAYPELAMTCHVSTADMKKAVSQAGLTIIDWRAFGILPFWGKRPGWLKFLLHERWKKIFQMDINGKMLDEWVSNFFIFKPFAYRHFLILRK